MDFNTTDKNIVEAATFTLLADNTIQYNGASGPQFASIHDSKYFASGDVWVCERDRPALV